MPVDTVDNCSRRELPWKLWVYTNYDCNLCCTYCLAESHPRAPRKAITLPTVRQLIDEAVCLGFEHVYFTGGEPMLLDDIYPMLSYACAHMPTTLLTNANLVRGKRLDQLCAVAHPNLTIQVSLDGGQAAIHDAYRGVGSWEKTIAGIRTLQARGFHVRLATTETSANTNHLQEICTFHQSLGIPESDHFVRPLAHRGASQAGLDIDRESLSPEITVNAEGVFWHPLSTDEDMRVSTTIFPLAQSVAWVQEKLHSELALRTVQ